MLKDREISFTILGNPFHLNDEVCERLYGFGWQKYQLSIDGMRKTHDWFRKPGSFDITLGKISCLKKAGIRAVIMTTVSGKNIREIPDIIDTVIATTHKESKLPLLKDADEAVLDTGKLQDRLSGVTKALELVGAKTLYDTLRCMAKGGIVWYTGILGGVYALNGFDPIKHIPNGAYLTGFYSNVPTQEVVDNIFSFIREKNLHPCVGAEYDFSEIREACVALDSGKVNGKIVVNLVF